MRQSTAEMLLLPAASGDEGQSEATELTTDQRGDDAGQGTSTAKERSRDEWNEAETNEWRCVELSVMQWQQNEVMDTVTRRV